MKALSHLLFLLFLCHLMQAQKVALDHESYDRWRQIEKTAISPDGQWLNYVLTPERGDKTLIIRNLDNEQSHSIPRGTQPVITHDSGQIIFRIEPELDTLWARKREKVKKRDLPVDSLGIFDVKTQNIVKVPELLDFKLPKEGSGWLAYRTQPDTLRDQKGDEVAYPLIIRELSSGIEQTIPRVKSYVFAEDGRSVAWISVSSDEQDGGVSWFDTDSKTINGVITGKGVYDNLGLSYTSKYLAFLADGDSTEKRLPDYSLYRYDLESGQSSILVRPKDPILGSGWMLNRHEPMMFSRSEERLFFGVNPVPSLKDTTLIEEEIVEVDIWNYKDGLLQTQQKVDAEKEKKRAYRAVYDLNKQSAIRLASLDIPVVTPGNEGNSDYSFGLSELPYLQERTWVSPAGAHDIYLIDNRSGKRSQVATHIRGDVSISPMGKFLLWYSEEDSAWFSYDIEVKKTRQLTTNAEVSFYRETWDYPDHPSSYGKAAWLEDDARVWVYDRYDIWELDPSGKEQPRNITANGRSSRTEYRYVKLDPDERYIPKKSSVLLHTYNNQTKQHGFASYSPRNGRVAKLLEDDYRFDRIWKARDTDRVILTKESFKKSPDLQLSNLSFSELTQVSEANPQQSEYLWGTEEMYTWRSADGVALNGILYKPADFDPSNKYPMMVYFYRRMSDRFHRYYRPYPGRSIINFSFYASRGYVIFVPDIVYKIGYPGESAFNSIMPGVTQLINEGFVDADRIGIQGHSWGGYQISYLVTRTNLFRAAEAGAPVANMFSAYGGIRWETGLSRMFQYERTQSRIGGSIWETPLRYLENSPLFWLDKVETPLLIMHNDADGHVPWYQGIELFVALRRLGKPTWMLTYNDQPHWPLKYQNRLDFQIRMQQYFDHYLKDAPAPEWMLEGVPAVEKGINRGLELMDKN